MRLWPVLIWNRAGEWLLVSVKQECRKARSSTWRARLGKISGTHVPDRPCCFQAKGDFISGPTWSAKKPVVLSKSLSSWPSRLASSGLWSQVSTWLGPPFMNSQMTALAFAGKCGGFGARGLISSVSAASAVSRPWRSSRAARASRPRPPPARRRKARREPQAGEGTANRCGGMGWRSREGGGCFRRAGSVSDRRAVLRSLTLPARQGRGLAGGSEAGDRRLVVAVAHHLQGGQGARVGDETHRAVAEDGHEAGLVRAAEGTGGAYAGLILGRLHRDVAHGVPVPAGAVALVVVALHLTGGGGADVQPLLAGQEGVAGAVVVDDVLQRDDRAVVGVAVDDGAVVVQVAAAVVGHGVGVGAGGAGRIPRRRADDAGHAAAGRAEVGLDGRADGVDLGLGHGAGPGLAPDVVLFKVRQDLEQPAGPLLLPGERLAGGGVRRRVVPRRAVVRQEAVRVLVRLHGDADLVQVVAARRPGGRLPHLL